MIDMIRDRKGIISDMEATGNDISGTDVLNEIFNLISDYLRDCNDDLTTYDEYDTISNFVITVQLRIMEMYGVKLLPMEKETYSYHINELNRLIGSRPIDEDDY